MKQNSKIKSGTKVSTSTLLIPLFLLLAGFDSIVPKDRLVGMWESEDRDLQIEMFEDGDEFSGRMIYFKCTSDEVMRTSKDIENPSKELRSRNLLGLTLVTKLNYQGENVWDDGKIYDPNSGNTFEARIHLIDANTAIVRGYWKYRWLGRSMKFKRIHLHKL